MELMGGGSEIMNGILKCPVCSKALDRKERAYKCPDGHSFDIAKENYVNLLVSSKNGELKGDDKYSARSRRDFLNRGYYSPLRDALNAIFSDKHGTILDICCGEGYYTSVLGNNSGLEIYGFDISKEMVRLAAKRGGACYFVANMANIPVFDESIDYAIHLFAPFNEEEFCRILKPGGVIYTVIPGKRHLYGLKELLYDTPYENDEKFPETCVLEQISKKTISSKAILEGEDAIAELFRMTPYYFHTSEKDRDKLEGIKRLETETEFVIGEFRKPV